MCFVVPIRLVQMKGNAMNRRAALAALLAACLFASSRADAQDWPQWRGANRDAKATGFKAPATWPKELTQKWKVTVGEGDSSPALVGDKLYVFARQDGNEVIHCLNAATGEEVWSDKYETQGATGAPSRGHAGPRASPAVGEGKVVTLGVRGVLSCYDTAGSKLWRKDDFPGAWPQFFTASSPIINAGQCIAQLGGASQGAIVSYDLTSGDKKWGWSNDGTAYSSPMVVLLDGAPVIVAMTAKNIVALSAPDQKVLWQVPFAGRGMGAYNAASPIVDSNIIIFSGGGRGTKAVKLEKPGSDPPATELWTNPDVSVGFNTPVLKDGYLYGLSGASTLFCISASDGKTAWTTPRIEGDAGYGSVVDAGSVMMAMTPAANLIIFAPDHNELKEIAKYKVADGNTYAYPIPSGNRIYVKDKDSVILWSID
jgi:outer membrane protein assembly factor BamB